MSDETQTLPSPRLQLRWTAAEPNENGCQWACHYELVLPLKADDIRRERGSLRDGTALPDLTELVIPVTEPTLRDSDVTPCQWRDGSRYCDFPFRNGCHARWDSAALGGLPVYVIAPDGVSFRMEPKS